MYLHPVLTNMKSKYKYPEEWLCEIWRCSRCCVILFHKVSKLKSPEKHYLRFLQLYMPWSFENELKQDNQSYEDRCKEVEDGTLCNTKKHETGYESEHEFG